MKKIIEVCDKCGTKVETAYSPTGSAQREEGPAMFVVGVGFRDTHEGLSCYDGRRNPEDFVKQRALWCQNCLIAMGLKIPPRNHEPKPDPPSFEELLRELVRECVDDQTNGG